MNNQSLYICFNSIMLLMLMWLPEMVVAQQNISLETCIQKGLENNLDFQIQQLKITYADKAQRSKGSRFLPQVAGGLTHNYSFGSTIDPASNARVSSNIQSNNFTVDANVSIFNFSELWESKLLGDDRTLALQNKAVLIRDYTLQLIQLYYDTYAAQEWKKVVSKQLEHSKEQLERIENEVNEGAKPVSDLYDIQVLYTQEKKIALQTAQEEANKKALLSHWINSSIDSSTTLTFIPPENGQVFIGTGYSPNVKLEELKAQKLTHEYKQLLAGYLPRVTLSYSYGTFYSSTIQGIFDTSLQFGSQLRNNKNQFLGLHVQVPIFSRGDRQRARQLKTIEIQEQQQLVEKTRVDFENSYSLEKQKKRQYEMLAPTLREGLEVAEKSLQTTQAKFEFGRIDISAYRMAKNQVLVASYDLLKNNLYYAMSNSLLKEMDTKSNETASN
ncbi:TolC family protein [Sphingobacterium psychroaquaticum]|uniref:Outer membrane protein n=1 Tax=Sphingobacterium psychroaquaticum TaxID=561061 RepID=A0A1X7JMZ0_9SPHI|nr:TolC family protein [Sphingobacterium psychroaquaticum]SMG29320.1 outer membrane protein [Sphingobacterium psychroaquaticum]